MINIFWDMYQMIFFFIGLFASDISLNDLNNSVTLCDNIWLHFYLDTNCFSNTNIINYGIKLIAIELRLPPDKALQFKAFQRKNVSS